MTKLRRASAFHLSNVFSCRESDALSRWEVGTLYRAHWRRAPILNSLVHLGEMVVQSLQSSEDRAREQCRKENRKWSTAKAARTTALGRQATTHPREVIGCREIGRRALARESRRNSWARGGSSIPPLWATFWCRCARAFGGGMAPTTCCWDSTRCALASRRKP